MPVFALVAGSWAEAGKKDGIRVSLHAQAAVTIIGAVDAAKAVAYNAKNMGYGDKTDSLTPMDLLRIIGQVEDPVAVRAAKRLFAQYADAVKGRHSLSFLGSARAAKALPLAADGPVAGTGERLGTVSGDAWNAVTKSGLREAVAQVRTREKLALAVLLAARFAGHIFIPPGWLILTPANKSVIEVKQRSSAKRS